ncbi:unnamed protein product, partial [marine sediment metagenome]
ECKNPKFPELLEAMYQLEEKAYEYETAGNDNKAMLLWEQRMDLEIEMSTCCTS